MISPSDRALVVELIQEASQNGARLAPACKELNISVRTYERWVSEGGVKEDQRPIVSRSEPKNKLTIKEKQEMLEVVKKEEFANLPPTQIVPKLADQCIYTGGFFVIKYREILRLHAQDLSNRGIASSCGCSKNTVGVVLKRAGEVGISWPLEKDMNDSELQGMLFPEKNKSDTRRKPDVSYIHKEMAKSGVTLSLLWHEYMVECRNQRKIPYSYRQFGMSTLN